MNDESNIPRKRCTRCGEMFPSTAEYFHRDRRSSDGLRSICKSCKRKDDHEYKRQNIDHIRKYYKQNANRFREYSQQYYHQNAERIRERDRKYRQRNAKRIRNHRVGNAERIRNHRQHPEIKSRRVISEHNRRARKRSLRSDFTVEQQQYALDHFNHCCAACGRQFHDLFGERTLSLDHWIPLTSPNCPGTTVTNMIPLCHGVDGCNNSKGSQEPTEWLISRFGKRKAREILARIEAYFEVVREQWPD